jgi:uncharacterized protein YcbK (DUF882 family)
MTTSRHFKEIEFNRCSPACSLQDMKQTTMNRFDTARELAGIPLVINSAYRSPEWDRARGRSGTGAHTLGRAIDIRCNTDRNRFKIIAALLRAGFTRIGIAKTYIHADDSPGHSQEVTWMY